jgi:hypothetical protein
MSRIRSLFESSAGVKTTVTEFVGSRISLKEKILLIEQSIEEAPPLLEETQIQVLKSHETEVAAAAEEEEEEEEE